MVNLAHKVDTHRFVGDSRKSALYNKPLADESLALLLTRLVDEYVLYGAHRCELNDGEMLAIIRPDHRVEPKVRFSGKVVRSCHGYCVSSARLIVLHDHPAWTGIRKPSWLALAHECTHLVAHGHGEEFRFWHAKVLSFLERIYEFCHGDDSMDCVLYR